MTEMWVTRIWEIRTETAHENVQNMKDARRVKSVASQYNHSGWNLRNIPICRVNKNLLLYIGYYPGKSEIQDEAVMGPDYKSVIWL